ncbi:MAG: hypothetical protein AAF989_02065, partial [Planctomycetota bacterium]
MWQLDLQRAEVALKAGRLEDVVDLLRQPRLRDHRKGQGIIDRVIVAYVQRGRLHAKAGRLAAAREDAYAAAQLGGRQIEVVELLEEIKTRWKEASVDAPGSKAPNPASAIRPDSSINQSIDRRQPTSRTKERQSLLLVDGLGGILLLPQDQIAVGGPSQARVCDLLLQCERVESPLVLSREGGDYMAVSRHPFQLNDRKTNRALLADEDRLCIGKRGRMRFRQRVPASGSAVLQLSTACTIRRDIQQIVLFDDSLLFGGTDSHFSVPGLRDTVVFSSNAAPSTGSIPNVQA